MYSALKPAILSGSPSRQCVTPPQWPGGGASGLPWRRTGAPLCTESGFCVCGDAVVAAAAAAAAAGSYIYGGCCLPYHRETSRGGEVRGGDCITLSRFTADTSAERDGERGEKRGRRNQKSGTVVLVLLAASLSPCLLWRICLSVFFHNFSIDSAPPR